MLPVPNTTAISVVTFSLLLLTTTTFADDTPTYILPLPATFTFGNDTLTVDPGLSLSFSGNSPIISDAFLRYKRLIFKHASKVSGRLRFLGGPCFDISVLHLAVNSSSDELQLGVDESYTLSIERRDKGSIVGAVMIEANTVYGALRALETFSKLCIFDYGSKTVQVYKAPWYIQDEPRFPYRGLLIDTSRHYLPVDVIKQILDSMSYAKL